MIFTASWCGPCQRLKEAIAAPDVAGLVARYNVKFVDIDKEKHPLVTVQPKEIPYYFIHDSHNRINKVGQGFYGKEAFIKWLKL